MMQKKVLMLLTFATMMLLQITFNGNTVANVPCLLRMSGQEYILDQQQVEHNHGSSIHNDIWIAQSFIPSMTPLTKIELKIDKPRVIQRSLEISVRKNLSGSELTFISIPASDIPFYKNWIEFDINDIEVTVNETYYIVVRSQSPSQESYIWLDEYNTSLDFYSFGEQWFSNNRGATWAKTETGNFHIDSTFRTYSYISVPDLECTGYFNWTEVKPGDVVNGSFTLTNIGTPLSYLSWKIYQWPSWGTWTFSKSSGSMLTPESGVQTIQVTVEAPHTDIPDTYMGKITIINIDDPEDYEIIDAQMITPHRSIYDYDVRCMLFFEMLKYHHPFFADHIFHMVYNSKI
jgi:hypothetical protein